MGRHRMSPPPRSTHIAAKTTYIGRHRRPSAPPAILTVVSAISGAVIAAATEGLHAVTSAGGTTPTSSVRHTRRTTPQQQRTQ